MNCSICYEDTEHIYTIACGSKVPHQICTSCKDLMQNKHITCPFCRIVENSVDAQFRQYLKTYFTVAENFHYKIRALGATFNTSGTGTFHIRVRRVPEPEESDTFHEICKKRIGNLTFKIQHVSVHVFPDDMFIITGITE